MKARLSCPLAIVHFSHFSLSLARCSQSSRKRLVPGGTGVEHPPPENQVLNTHHLQTRLVQEPSGKAMHLTRSWYLAFYSTLFSSG